MSKRAPLWLIVDDTQTCPDDFEGLLARDPELVFPSCFTYSNSSQWTFSRDPAFFDFAGGSSNPMTDNTREGAGSFMDASSFGTNALRADDWYAVDFELSFIGALENLLRAVYRLVLIPSLRRITGTAVNITLLGSYNTDGDSGTPLDPYTVAVSIDGGQPSRLPLRIPSVDSHSIASLDIRDLEDGRHRIKVLIDDHDDSRFYGVDHALVKAGEFFTRGSVAYSDRVPILAYVNYDDANLEYTGKWEDVILESGLQGKQTTTVGSAVQLQFYGEHHITILSAHGRACHCVLSADVIDLQLNRNRRLGPWCHPTRRRGALHRLSS